MTSTVPREFQRLCVFCGSRSGADSAYRDAAESLGRLFVARQIGLVYGGGSVGLMGIVADAVLAAGGEVIGVIPEMLATRELLHPSVTDMHTVPSMHARKALMADLSDGFIALPGGYGTFEELFEVATWAQLGIHSKPVGLLNVRGFFDPLVALIKHAVQEGFIKPTQRSLIVVAEKPDDLLARLAAQPLPPSRLSPPGAGSAAGPGEDVR